MPAALIEIGFLTNATEQDYLNTDNGQTYIASGIYRAFKEYKSEVSAK
jgi:N-acetylmuramoyl-L-alanine amidase